MDHGSFLLLLQTLPDYLNQIVEFLYYSGWRQGAAHNLEWRAVDLEGRTARLRIASSKNKESWIVPLAGRLWDIIEGQLIDRCLDCRYVFHRDGRKIGDFNKAWKTACKKSGLGRMGVQEDGRKKYVGTIPHDMGAAQPVIFLGLVYPEQLAMKEPYRST